MLALALSHLDSVGASGPAELVSAMAVAQAARTPDFVSPAGRPTTHVSVIDARRAARAPSMCTNGEGRGLVVPGTGIHINNVMGEEDLSPFGRFHATARDADAVDDGADADARPRRRVQARLRLRGLQPHPLRDPAADRQRRRPRHGRPLRAVEAPRLHLEGETVYTEPGIDLSSIDLPALSHTPFRATNLFFGGAQAVERDPETGALTGAGDPRRGGAAVAA